MCVHVLYVSRKQFVLTELVRILWIKLGNVSTVFFLSKYWHFILIFSNGWNLLAYWEFFLVRDKWLHVNGLQCNSVIKVETGSAWNYILKCSRHCFWRLRDFQCNFSSFENVRWSNLSNRNPEQKRRDY